MRKLGTIDLEILQLAVNQNGTFNETHLENSKLKRHGVGKILDTLASLKDRKFISMNENGSFTITELAKEILWSSKIPIWAKILRLLQIKSCDLQQIIETIDSSEDKVFNELEQLRKNQLVLMSPQRLDDKLIKVYEILPEGIEVIDKTETQGFENINFQSYFLFFARVWVLFIGSLIAWIGSIVIWSIPSFVFVNWRAKVTMANENY